MVKAGVRAMDAATEFLTSDSAPQEIQDLNMNPTQWVVSGASKRGWTAWLVASVDPRVVATVPVVMDLLNFKENIMHQFKAYGGWSFALEPYWEMNRFLMLPNADHPVVGAILEVLPAINTWIVQI